MRSESFWQWTRRAGVVWLALAPACSESEATEHQPGESSAVPSAPASAPPAEPPPPPWDGPAQPARDVLGDDHPETMEAQRERLFQRMDAWFAPGADAMAKIRDIFGASSVLSQGNPKPTEHPMRRSECLERRAAAQKLPEPDPRCGARNMVPIYDPGRGETAATASVCIDQFEFPNIPCEYPVTLVRANEAHELCQALGKRLCDAHEWEGACAGAVLPIEREYLFGKDRINQQYYHNKDREIRWAYGKEKNHALCGTGSRKSKGCLSSEYQRCGTNTFPAGSFLECVSPFGVYDQHGNAAEHMNLAMQPEQLTARGGTGETEMKGSWFIFGSYEAHIDDCHWRAPDWHGGPVASKESHRNFHLGFRCCKSLE